MTEITVIHFKKKKLFYTVRHFPTKIAEILLI